MSESKSEIRIIFFQLGSNSFGMKTTPKLINAQIQTEIIFVNTLNICLMKFWPSFSVNRYHLERSNVKCREKLLYILEIIQELRLPLG
ncbi:hypothetical protein BpHYR1_002031 [Brachionus plicatilis]|uniref:Uncharacterized protein n=1 Tax=Brachionus plicatilis TaxID=10195 RepID=A0A3M7RAZ0_BRAPC|nr:hypothetical protein BpHYR1_002031 [Brachionus plicatilis]